MKSPNINKALEDLQALKPPPDKHKKQVATGGRVIKQNKPKRRLYNKLREDKKRQLLLRAYDLYAKGIKTKEIAKKLGVGYGTMFELLSSDASFDYIKNAKSKVLAIQFLDDIAENRKAQSKLRSEATFSQLGMDIGIKWDKVHPPYQAAVQIDNRSLEVKFSKWSNNPFIAKGKKRRG